MEDLVLILLDDFVRDMLNLSRTTEKKDDLLELVDSATLPFVLIGRIFEPFVDEFSRKNCRS
jgi:hypothetical protein